MRISLSFFCNISTDTIHSPHITVDIILEEACNMMNVSVTDAISKTRKYDMCIARALFITYCRKHSIATLSDIGKAVNRDHSTVIHALKLSSTDHIFKIKYEQFETKLINQYAPVH